MKKQIPIDELQPGMQIDKLDRSWLDTAFFRHRMTVTSFEQIAQLKASGVRTLVVNLDAEEIPDTPEMEPDIATDPVFAAAEEPASVSPIIPFEEELPDARRVYQAAKTIVQNAMHDTRLGRAINMDEVNRVVSDMTGSVLRNPDALTSLSRLKKFDEYTFYHSVNTSIPAMSLGRDLSFERNALQPGRFESHEMEIMKQHVLRGVEVLTTTTGLGDSYLRPALEHHERVDGTGYPHRRVKSELSQFGLIAAVIDIYDAITSDRCYHKGRAAYEALQFLYRLALEGHLDTTLVQRFIHVVGVYPVGSVVELNTGEVAIVKQVHHHVPLTPVVLLVKSAGNTLLSKPYERDLAAQIETPRRKITAILDSHQAGIDSTVYLDKKVA
jgi:HD-GYP domain-containing protein (c-di-GMP phosphodiesterase class II)